MLPAPESEPAAASPAKAIPPKPEAPLHERLAKDSWPNAPLPNGHGGSAVWFGSNGDRYPLRER
jgi:hypothetical protein